jgi:hypothetical protein
VIFLFLFTKGADRLWGQPFLFSRYRDFFLRGQSGRKLKMTTQLHVQPMFRMSGSVPPLLFMCLHGATLPNNMASPRSILMYSVVTLQRGFKPSVFCSSFSRKGGTVCCSDACFHLAFSCALPGLTVSRQGQSPLIARCLGSGTRDATFRQSRTRSWFSCRSCRDAV